MHISTVFLNAYSPNELINGHCDIEHEGITIKVQFSEADRHTIQEICVKAYEIHKQKVLEALANHSPAYVALTASEETKENIQEAEFDPLDDLPEIVSVAPGSPIDLDDEVPF